MLWTDKHAFHSLESMPHHGPYLFCTQNTHRQADVLHKRWAKMVFYAKRRRTHKSHRGESLIYIECKMKKAWNAKTFLVFFLIFARNIYNKSKNTPNFFNLPFLAFLLSARFYVPSSSLPYDENEFVWESPSSLEKQVKSEENKLDFLHPENVWKCHREINFCNFTFGKEGKRLLEHFDEFMREKLIFKQFFSIAGKLLLRLVVWRVTFKEIFTTSKLVLKYVPKKSF